MPEKVQVSLLETVIIYLSAGAPFGVLVLFSQRSTPVPVATFKALLATVAWPVFGTYRLYRGLARQRHRPTRPDSDVDPLEVLERISKERPTEAAELFSIAGHSNPWIATNCYARSRKKVIESHIDRLSRTSVETGDLPSSSATEPIVSSRRTTLVNTSA